MDDRSDCYPRQHADVPWGRPPVPDVPVPPFRDRAAWVGFHRDLAVYCAHLAKAAGTVDPVTFALLSAVEQLQAAARRDRPPAGGAPSLEPWVLRVAISVFFPAPWTPAGLAEQFNAAELDPYRHWTVTAQQIGYSNDPEFQANRAADGSWTVIMRERGAEWVAARPASDDDMVLCLMEEMRTNPYPFGWQNDPAVVQALAEPAARFSAAWPAHAALPYLRDWPS